ncbi:hypothetical protein BU26DRAFT_522318 [Trematosphaeria pertusa]|uniref:Uncharacterized protein n=1 Tax=Trematosphaeria pertusa TaxID=390896 RepID=A0A6A6I4R8_9PLEO|nr:uncharacterized protein BU26DRAFT_522318 [Trematosphaeria pertusa]KAF2245219.1 hypothetical protein BU26DRAFT_522318 [Trematosphaeria pertusa]
MSQTQKRIIIQAYVTDIPGTPEERPFQLGNEFCKQMLERPIKAQVQLPAYDNIHLLPKFDSQKGKAWFIYDLDVTGRMTREELSKIPHEVYLASCRRDGDNVFWTFTPREIWSKQAKNYASMYTWGGGPEQERLAKLKGED